MEKVNRMNTDYTARSIRLEKSVSTGPGKDVHTSMKE